MKIIKILLIFVLSILVIGVTSVMILIMTGKLDLKGFRFNQVSTKLAFEKTYTNTFSGININTEAADIEIKEAVGNETKLTIYDDYDKYTVTDNGSLDIKVDSKKCHFICLNIKKAKIILYIPTDYAKDISIDSDYGDVEIGNFINASFNADLDYGDVKVGSVNDIKIKSDYGDIKIGTVNNHLDIKDDYGDIKIDNVNLKNNSYINDNFGDIKIGTTNEVYIDAKTDYGDVKITNNYRKSDITLKLRTDYGDIKVKN